MEFRDLKKQYRELENELNLAVLDVMRGGQYIGGKWVTDLEQRLADYVGVKHCISCANGTDAIALVLMSWGIGPGDAVFVPDFTFFATGEAVAQLGATPVFVDVDPNTFNIDPNSFKEAVSIIQNSGRLNPAAVIPVDLFGLPADYPALEAIAKKYEIKILEDGAQGLGGAYMGRRACSFGDAATTSFFPSKPLGCYGDGGAIFTNNDNLANMIKSLKVHGRGNDKYDNIRIGMNSRLDTLQAAILDIKLSALIDFELERVNWVYEEYSKKMEKFVKVPFIPEGYYSSFAQYTIQLGDERTRNMLQKNLRTQGIPTMVYYKKPMHEQKAFEGAYEAPVDLGNSLKLCETVLSLPMHPYLDPSDIELITSLVIEEISNCMQSKSL
jgi:UDP-2-acetamido-2-deoxy-ribo-hexuluronate aminotransferase